MRDFLAALSNGASLHLGGTDSYAAILGLAPSKGARSPLLWNRAFNALGLSAVMHPMDVSREDLATVVSGLKGDSNFIGGAVAVPHKTNILPLLDEIEEEARLIGAVNCIYRRGGLLVGGNTDGAASLLSIQRLVGDSQLGSRCVLLLGVGGAGRAVATFVAKALGSASRLVLANRSPVPPEFAAGLRRFCQVESPRSWPTEDEMIREADLIINCTSIGSDLIHNQGSEAYSFIGYTPLAPVDAVQPVKAGDGFYLRFAEANRDAIMRNIEQSWRKLNQTAKSALYDIVYQPTQTVFQTLGRIRGLKTLGGELMNLEQAVIAFVKAVQPYTSAELHSERVKAAMIAA